MAVMGAKDAVFTRSAFIESDNGGGADNSDFDNRQNLLFRYLSAWSYARCNLLDFRQTQREEE